VRPSQSSLLPPLQGASRTHPKLPAQLFSDLRPDGPLTFIASRMHKLKKARDIRKLDWGNQAQRRQASGVSGFVWEGGGAYTCHRGDRRVGHRRGVLVQNLLL
jgi:hypothetical protein